MVPFIVTPFDVPNIYVHSPGSDIRVLSLGLTIYNDIYTPSNVLLWEEQLKPSITLENYQG